MTIQSIPIMPMMMPETLITSISNYTTIDADGEGVASMIQVPASGTCTDIAFPTRTVTTGDAAFSVRLETIDASTGLPSGTLIDSPTNAAYGSVNIADGDDNKIISCSINSGSGISCTRGDFIAIKLTRPASGTFKGQILCGSIQFAAGINSYPIIAQNTGSWAKVYNIPLVAMKIDGVWYCPPSCGLTTNINTVSINDPGTPKQVGILINKPIGFRLAGAAVFVAAASAEDYQLKLYSGPTEATPTLLATSNNFDADFRESVNGRWTTLIFNTSIELTKDTDYVLVVNPTTADEIQVYYQEMGAATFNAVLPGGANATYYYRSDTGAFTETNTRVPLIIPLFDGIDLPAGGSGGGPIMGGMVVR